MKTTMTRQERAVFIQELEAKALNASHVTLPISQILALADMSIEAEYEIDDLEQEVEELVAQVEGR
jgi:dephospho-CoA kinase